MCCCRIILTCPLVLCLVDSKQSVLKINPWLPIWCRDGHLAKQSEISQETDTCASGTGSGNIPHGDPDGNYFDFFFWAMWVSDANFGLFLQTFGSQLWRCSPKLNCDLYWPLGAPKLPNLCHRWIVSRWNLSSCFWLSLAAVFRVLVI